MQALGEAYKMTNTYALTPRKIFAKNLRRTRRMQEMSQEALALKAGMSRAYVGEVERERRNISIDNMGLLAEALGVELKNLLDPALFSPVKQVDG
jgi:transcriptional regulator with XRE-family HTH domain